MQTKIIKSITFLIFLSFLIVYTGCFLFSETEEEKQARKTRKFSDNLIAYGVLALNKNVCLERTNIDITEGQILSSYAEDLCFKISISGNTSVTMLTPGTTFGKLTVYSSDAIPLKREILYEDDPTLTITGPGVWYARTRCNTCSSYSVQIP